jgi:hypothetical protein
MLNRAEVKSVIEFNYDILADGFNSGLSKKVNAFWDFGHDGRPEHIDLHVFTSNGGIKYSNLSNVDSLRDNFPWLNLRAF